MTKDPRANSEKGAPETESFEAQAADNQSRKSAFKNQLPNAWKWILAAGLIFVLLAGLAGFLLMKNYDPTDREVTVDEKLSVSRPAATTKNKYQTGDETPTMSRKNSGNGYGYDSGYGSGYDSGYGSDSGYDNYYEEPTSAEEDADAGASEENTDSPEPKDNPGQNPGQNNTPKPQPSQPARPTQNTQAPAQPTASAQPTQQNTKPAQPTN